MWLARFETGGAEPCSDIMIGKPKPTMSMLFAQEFKRVQREVDNNQTTARPQHPPRLCNSGGRAIGIMQHLVDNGRIKRPIRQRQLVHVPQPDNAVR
jgi:hypothetical protein